MTDWQRLGIEPTSDVKSIKLAYANLLKTYHPEEDPEGFMVVQQAYQRLLKNARKKTSSEQPVSIDFDFEVLNTDEGVADDPDLEKEEAFAYLQEEYKAEQFLTTWLENLPMVVTFEQLLAKLTELDGNSCWDNPFFYPLLEEALLNCYPHGKWAERQKVMTFCQKHGLYQLETYFSQVGLTPKQVEAQESNEILY